MEYTGKFEAGQWVYVAEDVSQSLPLNSRSQHAEVRSKQGKRLKVQFWPRALFPVIDLQKDAIVSLTFFLAEADLVSCEEHKCLARLAQSMSTLL